MGYNQEMRDLRSQLLEELIDLAYAKRGYRPLSPEETKQLVASCIKQMEALTQPQVQGVQR